MAFYIPEKHKVEEPNGLMSRPWITLFQQITSVIGAIIGPSGIAPMDLLGTRAAQPLPGTVPAGTLYFVTDEKVIERSNGAAWAFYSVAQSAGGGIANISITGDIEAGAARLLGWVGRSRLFATADGIIELTDNAGTAFDRLQLGGTTSSFPAIKRSGILVQFRLADDSTWAETQAARIRSIIATGGAGLNAILQSNSDTAAFGGGVLVRKSRGTEALPTAILSGDQLGGMFAQGYDGTDYGPTNVAAILIVAAENYAVGTKGTHLDFATTPIGSATRASRWRIASTGHFLALDPTLLIQWGATAAFPAFKRSTTFIQARLADDSNYASFDAGTYSVGGVAGASGTFQSADGKSVTATNGIVTAVTAGADSYSYANNLMLMGG